MDLIRSFIDLILHLDRHLQDLIANYGAWTYAFLFAIIFCETGLVVTPFLPGDSLIFAAGALAAIDTSGSFNVFVVWVLLMVAAVLGDTVNYWLGKYIGERIFEWKLPFVKREYLERTHQFYEKHGGKTIILARFVPIVRTFAPFVAGVGEMTYGKFFSFNVIGGTVWVTLFTFAGYAIGNVPLIKNNFSLVTIVIILVSVTPMIIDLINARREAKAA